MNIDKLEAGQELDILMAELLNWTRAIEGIDGCVTFLTDDSDRYFISEWPIALRRGTHFNPSRLEDSAGIVTDWLVAQGYTVTVYTGPYRDQGVKARCCILRAGDLATSDGVDALADTRPLAICRAALRARERWGKK